MESKPTYQDLENQLAKFKKPHEISHLNSATQNEQIYHSLFKNMTEGFAHCQMLYENNDPVDFIYLEVNHAFEILTGLKNVVGKRISEVIVNHKNENQELFNLYNRVSKTGISERVETFVPPLEIWFSISVYSLQKGEFLVIFDNITERKKSEEVLRISEAKFRGLFIQSHIGTAIVGLDKCFIKCNEAFCRFLGYSEEELIGKTIADFTYPEDKEIGMKELKMIVKGDIESTMVQKRYLRKDGVVVWGELTISIVQGEDTRPLYFLPIIQDITERHMAEQKLKESEASLKKLNATKDKLFSIIAHDLRSPFSGILGFSELLKENLKERAISQSEKYAAFINSSAKNTLVLLDNLLNWAKSQTGQISFNPQKIVLSSSIQEIIEIINSQAKIKNISLHKVQLDEIEVYADENMLRIILQNLISNAIKFTKSGGNINIVVISDENQVEISISDNGIGIDKEKLKTLFRISSNESSLGTANEKGSGLGLVLCKEFVEKQGGIIWVESEDGEGSDFKFTLPLYKL
ncbi:PAS domain S-box protein [uncultured Lutibacter sp.]|uniref:sensor histidine kinase n=1 Tax=uncultured Lutibacter sp. TaxID=437739 RepID=UPI00261B1C32|nr:PAS domain S-box protein [uncultured Lutibacter sp.]